MKCVVATAFGKPNEVLSLSDQPCPTLTPGSGHLLLRVQACSLSPSDWRMLSGDTRLLKKPSAGFPYIPGLDVSGVVEAVDAASAAAAAFSVGDAVVGTWGGVFGVGGMAEYALVDARYAAKRPEGMSAVIGAALANSASHALNVVREAQVKEGDRVMVVGGSGGVGSVVVQLARWMGAGYVAATSTQVGLLTGLRVDRVVDYREEEWTAVPEFAERPFDVVIDCAVGRATWEAPRLRRVLKGSLQGGRFVAVVAQEWHIELQSWLQLPGLFGVPLMRQLWATLSPWNPAYKMHLGGPTAEVLAEVLAMVKDRTFKVVLDEACPFPFSEQGTKDAFNLMMKRRAHGKVVVQME
jgi:NADPH:quinone reductase-like Zn-dependent oxidoreductase